MCGATRHRSHRGEVDRVAVRRRGGDVLGGDVAAGAGPVLDDDRLPDVLGELLGDDAGRGIGAAAGREADGQGDRTVGEGLGERTGRQGPRAAATVCEGVSSWCLSVGTGHLRLSRLIRLDGSSPGTTTCSSPAAATPRCARRSPRAGAGLSVLVVESRADPLPRRQQPSHAQHAHHARRAARRAHRRVSRGGVLGGPAQGHGRPHRREARAHDHPRQTRGARAVDDAARRALPARRSAARCTSRAPTRSSWAAARR